MSIFTRMCMYVRTYVYRQVGMKVASSIFSHKLLV